MRLHERASLTGLVIAGACSVSWVVLTGAARLVASLWTPRSRRVEVCRPDIFDPDYDPEGL